MSGEPAVLGMVVRRLVGRDGGGGGGVPKC